MIETNISFITKIRNFLKKHSISMSIGITFLISWGSCFYILGIDRIIGTPQERKELLYTVVFPLLAGPTLASLGLITIIYGKTGIHDFVDD